MVVGDFISISLIFLGSFFVLIPPQICTLMIFSTSSYWKRRSFFFLHRHFLLSSSLHFSHHLETWGEQIELKITKLNFPREVIRIKIHFIYQVLLPRFKCCSFVVLFNAGSAKDLLWRYSLLRIAACRSVKLTLPSVVFTVVALITVIWYGFTEFWCHFR